MKKEGPKVAAARADDAERARRREALETLSEARDKLLQRMTEDVLSNQDVLREGAGPEGMSTFELEEIEDRYSARLNALNSLLENLEYRRPVIRHRAETMITTQRAIEKDINELLAENEQWDLVDISVCSLEGDKLLVVVAFTVDEYPEE